MDSSEIKLLNLKLKCVDASTGELMMLYEVTKDELEKRGVLN
jgi:hypothetical protein